MITLLNADATPGAENGTGNDMSGMTGMDGMMPGHHGGHLGTDFTPGHVPSLWDMLTSWDAGWFYSLFLVALAGIYVFGAVRLWRRGDKWSPLRTLSWLFGVITLALVTGTGVWTWGMMLFSTHMVQHMVVGMLTPIFLVAAAPITLVLRNLPAQGRGSGIRRGVLLVLNSPVTKVWCSPLITVGLFIASLYVLYFTPLLDVAMETHLGHVLMIIHFIAVGILFFGPILAVDPWPRHNSAGARLLEMLIATPFHAFFGVAVMSGGFELSQHFADMGTLLGIDSLEDQRVGGGIAWAFGELPILVVGAFLFAQWVRDEFRAAKRYDRRAQRDDDAELKRYNEQLSRLNNR